METFQLIFFDQTRSPQCSLGSWWSWQGDVAQLRSAANQLLRAPNPGSLRIFTIATHHGIALPTHHELLWDATLEDERELTSSETAAWLQDGGAIQIFIYNGDSDCVRHLVALPITKPEPWYPQETR